MSQNETAHHSSLQATRGGNFATFLPGAMIGIVGGGQLGRMSALAARRMGYRVAILDPDANCPAAPVADTVIVGAYGDAEALRRLAEVAEVITVEFENIPAEALAQVAELRPVRPRPEALHTCQHREREKRFLHEQGFPVANFRVITDAASLEMAVADIGLPCVLKTAEFGYDGKGQALLRTPEDVREAAQGLNGLRWVLEEFVEFEKEISAVCARNPAGQCAVFPVAENEHRHHILHASTVPAGVPASVQEEAAELARKITAALGVVGLLAVEFFVTKSGGLIVNELAPRPHNSGHYSFDACLTSQFEQHIRAVAGLPLGDPALLRPVVMINLLGDLWSAGNPDWAGLLEHPGLKLHLYGKSAAKPGRKMGHFCLLGEEIADLRKNAEVVFAKLSGNK